MLRRDDLRHESGLVHCHLVHGVDVCILLRFDGAALCAMTARFENFFAVDLHLEKNILALKKVQRWRSPPKK